MPKGIMETRRIFCAVRKVFGLTGEQLTRKERSRRLSMARGVYCLVCDAENIHSLFSCKVIQRSRNNVVNIARHYRGYYDTGDKEVVLYYGKVLELIK